MLQDLTGLVSHTVSAQYIQSMLLQRGSQTALLPLPVDMGLTAAAKLGSSMLLFAITFTGQLCTAALCLLFCDARLAFLCIKCSIPNLA